jgi:hypothetical protein
MVRWNLPDARPRPDPSFASGWAARGNDPIGAVPTHLTAGFGFLGPR